MPSTCGMPAQPKKHYCNFHFYILETHCYHIANTASFYPAHCKQPANELGDTIRHATQDLISAIRDKAWLAPISLHHSHTEVLKKLADIFATAASEKKHPIPRVPPRQPSSSVSPTNPNTVQAPPHVHQRVTHWNKQCPMTQARTNWWHYWQSTKKVLKV